MHGLIWHLVSMVLLQVLGIRLDRFGLSLRGLVLERRELRRRKISWVDAIGEKHLMGLGGAGIGCSAHLLTWHALLRSLSVRHHATMLRVERRVSVETWSFAR